MVPQNGNRPSQDARHRTPMNPTKSTPASAQTGSNAFTQLSLLNKSSAIEVRFKEEKFSGTPTNALTQHSETSSYVQIITASPMMNTLN